MEREIVVIGAGISGLTAAALLAKKGFFVTVIDAQFKPGGSCGIFKRRDVIFDLDMYLSLDKRGAYYYANQ